MNKVGILSPCGTGNLGDETTVAVLIEAVRARYPDAQIYGLTSNPADTRERHGIEAYAARNTVSEARVPGQKSEQAPASEPVLLRLLKRIPFLRLIVKAVRSASGLFLNLVREVRFLASSFSRVQGTDLLIVAGSGQLCDNFYGVWGFPYTLLKWSIIAKLLGAKLAFLSCGAGPIDSWLSRIFIKCALGLAEYRSFRDDASKDLIERIGLHNRNLVFPDLVFSAKLASHGHPRNGRRVVAINPFPHYDSRYWPVSRPRAYTDYINRLASFAAWLIRNDYTVLFFPTQLRADPLVIEDVRDILKRDPTLDLDTHLLVKPNTGVDDLIAQLSAADIVVASRFHGVLISFLLNKPVLALSHHPKVESLMRDMGQSDYVLDIDTFDLHAATDRLLSLESNSDLIRQQIQSNVTTYQRRLESQYSEVFQ